MKKSALILAALMMTGCAHQGSSARYESGSASSSSSAAMEPASDQYYSSPTWRDMEVEAPPAPDQQLAAPTAGDYLRGIELAQDDPTLAQQLDPATDLNATGQAGRDVDASASASIGIAVGGAASTESGSATSDDSRSEPTQNSDGLITSSTELPGAEAREMDKPAALAPLKDNHPDITDAPNYPQGFTPESAIGGAASAETGSATSAASGSSTTSVEVEDGNLSNNNLEAEGAPIDVRVDRDESDFSAPLGGGVPSDGSSTEINSGSSVDRTSPEAGAISTPIGILSETEKTPDSSSVSREEPTSPSSLPEASGAPAATQSGSASGSGSAADFTPNPDRDLSDQVYRQLQSNPPGTLTEDNLRDIKIIAKDGVVPLNGSVDSDSEKGMIEQGISRMQGVKSVQNNLSVGKGQPDNAPEPHEK